MTPPIRPELLRAPADAVARTAASPNAAHRKLSNEIAAEILEARRIARERGEPDITEADVAAYVAERSGGQVSMEQLRPLLADAGFLAGVGRSFMQGMASGWADEAIEATQPGAGAVMRERDKAFADEHPVVDVGSRLAGGVAQVLATPAMRFLTGAKTLVAAVARGAATGAAGGAVTGAGEADPGERVTGAVAGAIGGGLLGTALPVGVAGARLMSPGARAARRLNRAIGEEGGPTAIMERLQNAQVYGKEGEIMLADLGRRLQLEADFAANASDEVLAPMSQRLAERQANQAGRLLDDARIAMTTEQGTSPAGRANLNAKIEEHTNPFGTRRYSGVDESKVPLQAELDAFASANAPAAFLESPVAARRAKELTEARRAWAASEAGFQGLRDRNPVVPAPTLARFLRVPRVMQAYKQARLAGDIDEANVPPGIQLIISGQVPPNQVRPASFQDLHAFREILDGKATAAFASKDKTALGPAYKMLRDQVDDAIEASVPEYKGVRAEYARRMRQERALAAGEKAWRMDDSGRLEEVLKGLSPEELKEFRYGMASRWLADLGNTKTNRNAAQSIMDMSKATREKIEVVFGNNRHFKEFIERVKIEGDMARTRAAVGGSATARRLANADLEPMIEGGVITAASGAPPTAAAGGVLSRLFVNKARRGTANAMRDDLMATGYDDINAAIRRITERSRVTPSRRASVGAQALSARLPSLLFE